jgi:hypothetical protein
MDWREWLAAGMGQGSSGEVLVARQATDRRGMRDARRLVRQGRAAPDPARARLVVALARESQRQHPGIGLTLFFAVLVVAWASLFVVQVDRGHVLLAIVWAAATIFGVHSLWVTWRVATNAAQAELNNLQLLEEAGQPYPPDAPAAAPASVSYRHRAISVAVLFVLYDLVFGALSQAMDGKSLSFDAIAQRGAIFAVFMVIANLTVLRGARERRAQRPTAGPH